MFTYKVDENITLRLLKAKDAERLFALIDRSRPYLQRWLSWVSETKNVNDALHYILNAWEIYTHRRGLNTGIFYKDDLVGIVSFNQFDWIHRIGYIGYWLSMDYQGHGIMTKSVRALINIGFEHFQLKKVEIRVAKQNEKSKAIPKRLGFKKSGVLKDAEWLYNRYVDHIVFTMDKREWKY